MNWAGKERRTIIVKENVVADGRLYDTCTDCIMNTGYSTNKLREDV